MTDSTVATLKASLRGGLITPSDSGYDEARKVYNGMIDRRPKLIARCADVADVITAVNFARDNKLVVSIRGGGHNAGGLGVCDGGLVIDLSPMRYVRVDPKKKTVIAGGGALWGDVDHATHAFGLAVPSGIISTTGVGGLTLGGGIGHLTRQLRAHHRQSARRRDGAGRWQVRHRDAPRSTPICSGRCAAAAATSASSRRSCSRRTRSTPSTPGRCCGPSKTSVEVLQWYRNFIAKAPRELNGFFALLIVPPGPPFPEHLHHKKMCGVVWCYTGPLEKAEEVFKPIRAFKQAGARSGRPDSASGAPEHVRRALPAGPAVVLEGRLRERAERRGDRAARRCTAHACRRCTRRCTCIRSTARPARVKNDATPWGYRDAKWAQVIVGVDPDPANKDTITTGRRTTGTPLHPYSRRRRLRELHDGYHVQWSRAPLQQTLSDGRKIRSKVGLPTGEVPPPDHSTYDVLEPVFILLISKTPHAGLRAAGVPQSCREPHQKGLDP